MKDMFINSKWIWLDKKEDKDEYAKFKFDFIFDGKSASIALCAETDYILYLNDKVITFGQFAGYRKEKYYDKIDLTDYCKAGVNRASIVVRYEGLNSFRHIDDGAGLIFELKVDEAVVLISDKNVLSGLCGEYLQGEKRLISPQLGYTSTIVADGMTEYFKSKEFCKTCVFSPRPVAHLVKGNPIYGKLMDVKDRKIYDLGVERSGYLNVQVDCDAETELIVAFGEHLADGKVRRIINNKVSGQNRDFSIKFILNKGRHNLTQYFVKLACRYLEVISNANVNIKKIGLIPYEYPVQEKTISLSGIDSKIYDISLRTLKLCMDDHYEDCPWREQALYALDSRNQMLCGYYAFKGSEYQRANLVFMSKGKRPDGLLELTYPAEGTPAIPFFSIIFGYAVCEYVEHTADFSIFDEVGGTVNGIVEIFKKSIDNTGLIKNLPYPYWNFYEWTSGSDGDGEFYKGADERVEKYDLLLNATFVMLVQKLKIFKREYVKDIDENDIKQSIVKTFFNENTKLYKLSTVGDQYSKLGNAVACLIGLGNERIINALKGNELIEETLSMAGFIYDALLQNDKANEGYVLENIRTRYGYMLSKGATTVWETLKGYGEPNGNTAGSLCHGWSAMPIYYYNLIKKSGGK
ncbi:MAG: hypothetical protein E7369_02640 [Clostridiales bacterium]|nr:hypothetical protein [Clostridiales bacterium]